MYQCLGRKKSALLVIVCRGFVTTLSFVLHVLLSYEKYSFTHLQLQIQTFIIHKEFQWSPKVK